MRADLPPGGRVAVPAPHPAAAHPPLIRPPHYTLRQGLLASLGVGLGIGALAYGTLAWGLLLLGSFGSTAVMVFSFPDIHFSQPRSVVGGHLISSAVGLAALAWLGPSWWALALAAAAALALMMATRTLHPPAGSNPLIVFVAAPHWHFLLFPTLLGALALVGLGWLFHRASRRRYPLYWF